MILWQKSSSITLRRSFSTGSPHTGGVSILTKPELQDLIGFFNSPIGI